MLVRARFPFSPSTAAAIDSPASDRRAALRLRAMQADAARAEAMAHDDPAPLAWRDLTHARWSVFDTFETNGRRYVLARRPGGEGDPEIDTFDRIILARRAAGTALKVIASEIGLSISTVGRRLQSAMGRLGLRSLAELAALFAGANP